MKFNRYSENNPLRRLGKKNVIAGELAKHTPPNFDVIISLFYGTGSFENNYIGKVSHIFANDLDIDIKDCGGKNELQKLFKLFVKTDFDRFKIFFVFDCDATASFTDCNSLKSSSLIPYIFKKNQENTIEEVSRETVE
jgi:hypothetical protein